MNLDNDYDNDGNNIVPCPICMSKYCPSKEDGKCPDEDMFALEGEIRLLLDEYKATDDNSRIVNVLEAVEKLLHQELQKALEIQAIEIREEEANEYNKIIEQELQKAREEERERIIYITKNIKDAFMSPLTERRWLQCIQFTDQPKPNDQSELDQPDALTK